MGVTPEQVTVRRVESDHLVAKQGDQLVLPVHIDDDRSRRRVLKILFLPNQRAVPGIQGDYGMAIPAKLDNNRILVGDWAYRVATVHKSATGEILVEVLLPHNLAGFLVESVHLGQDSDGVNTTARDKR